MVVAVGVAATGKGQRMANEGFLGRWSRRKQGAREGQVLDEPAVAEPTPAAKVPPTVPVGAAEPATPAQPAAGVDGAPAEAPPALTLEDVAQLTRESDYSAFVARSVSPEVRNAAMRKLFADPHYNIMDGLDIYIDDYSKPAAMPAGMLAKLASARVMNLVDAPEAEASGEVPGAGEGTEVLPKEELPAQVVVGSEVDLTDISADTPPAAQAPAAAASAQAAEAPGVAPSALCNELPTLPRAATPQAANGAAHADADLRLQRDDAAGRPAHRPGTE